ncbi:hypothetical protein [Streptomyces chryseus]|uniref:Lipoprotein n=1 Tax=Streptomyces chryseus TaxID=68186 RepID=A0ABQ3DZE7_9ACTN|nr:hypothetical protein [Streptomyces chryseus]GHB21352.1 hypothetical protein GCM10010346_51330 [Streptomyces chryseus]
MRYGILTAALALGGACALGAAVLVTADAGDPGKAPAAPAATYSTGPKEKNVKPVAKGSDRAKAATKQSKDALAEAGLTIPEGWHPAQIRSERHEDRPVTVVRYEQDTTRDLGGEHITTVVDDEGTLYGYTRMTVAGAEKPVPADDKARETAFDWLRGFAPEHADGLSVQWVDQHDEEVRDKAGAAHTVSGAKVKTHHENGLYTWMIVDGDGDIVTYERDVRWDGAANRRATQMWLHDKWIAAREGSGPQPPSPYAQS